MCSSDLLAKAKKGVYEVPDTVPESWRKKYFKKIEGSRYAVSPEIRNNVIFQTFNLMDPIKFIRKNLTKSARRRVRRFARQRRPSSIISFAADANSDKARSVRKKSIQ